MRSSINDEKSSGVNIMVSGYINSGDTGAELLSSIKTAILFGDTVTLHSFQIRLALLLYSMVGKGIKRKDSLDLITPLFGQKILSQATLDSQSDPEEIIKIDDLDKFASESGSTPKKFFEQLEQLLPSDFARQIRVALDTENIIFSSHEYDLSESNLKSNPVIRGDLQFILSIFNNASHYPLFDKNVKKIIQMCLEAGLLESKASRYIKQVNLSNSIFKRIPSFHNLEMNDVLHLKESASSSLIRFRQAIVEFSDEIESNPWDNSFELEVNDLMIEKIYPSILEIEESLKENTIYKALLKSLVTKPLISGSTALSIGLSNVFGLNTIIPAAAAGIVAIGVNAFYEQSEAHKAIQKNRLYFLNDISYL